MNHVAVVLAAGGSTRLGRPKQLLTIAGETLVHRAVRMALATGPTRTIVVVGAMHAAVTAAIADLPCEPVFNPRWENGLAASLASAAGVLAPDEQRVLVVGCDQPRLDAGHLQRLVAAAAVHRPPFAATFLGDVIGNPAIVPAAWLGAIRVDDGDHGLRGRLRAAEKEAIAIVAAPELADDVDTPAQLAAAVAAGWIDADA
jgi:molybdenum cofactor cytidylyltransferase